VTLMDILARKFGLASDTSSYTFNTSGGIAANVAMPAQGRPHHYGTEHAAPGRTIVRAIICASHPDAAAQTTKASRRLF